MKIYNLLIFKLKKKQENTTNLIPDHYAIKGSKDLIIDKLTSTEIHSILISKVQNEISSNIYFKNLFDDSHID